MRLDFPQKLSQRLVTGKLTSFLGFEPSLTHSPLLAFHYRLNKADAAEVFIDVFPLKGDRYRWAAACFEQKAKKWIVVGVLDLGELATSTVSAKGFQNNISLFYRKGVNVVVVTPLPFWDFDNRGHASKGVSANRLRLNCPFATGTQSSDKALARLWGNLFQAVFHD